MDFWCKKLGAQLASDEVMQAPALDAMFGRQGVRIRDTFIRMGGIRLHTIETLDLRRELEGSVEEPHALGFGGVSFQVSDIETADANALDIGLIPTKIYEFSELPEPVRKFFLEDPNGIRVELMEARQSSDDDSGTR